MNKLKKILAVTAILALIGSTCSCGQTDTENAAESSAAIAVDSVSGNDSLSKIKDNDDTDSDKDGSSKTSDKSSKDESSAESASKTTTASSNKNASTTTAAKSSSGSSSVKSSGSSGSSDSDSSSSGNAGSGSSAQSGNNSSSDNASSSGNNSSGNSSGTSGDSNNSSGSNTSGNSNSGGSSETSDSQEQPATEQQAEETPTEAEKTYTAEITLGSSPQINGSNASADGSRVVITGGGDYLVSGSVDGGQIEVNTTEKVKLYLNGASITSYSGPAILVTDAKRFVLVLMEGTSSYLQDVNKDKANDGVICSNDTVEIKGHGSLDITAGNAHGITSDDDVVINNGTINITSVKSGIIANDDVTINGGEMYVYGGTNGIKSKGTLNVNGGYTVISGGSKEEKSSIYAMSDFNYTGGYVFAAGNMVTAPTSSVSPYVVAGFSSSQPAGSMVSLQLDGYEMISMSPHNNFKCVMMLAPEIASGSSFAIDVNGSWYGYYTVEDVQNVYTIE